MSKDNRERPRPSMAEMLAQRLERELEMVVAKLKECGNYDQLPQAMRTALYNLVSGGVDELAPCDRDARAGVAGKLGELQSILEKDTSESYVLKMLIWPHLKKMIEDLDSQIP